KLLGREENSKVRQQIVLMLGFMRTTHSQIGEVTRVLAEQYGKRPAVEERARTIQVMSNLPYPETARFLATAFSTGKNEEERLWAAAVLFKLASRVAVDPDLMKAI